MKICPVNLSSLIWGCQKQLEGRAGGCGGWEVSAHSFPPLHTLLPLCVGISVHSAVHSKAGELEEPGGMDREEGTLLNPAVVGVWPQLTGCCSALICKALPSPASPEGGSLHLLHPPSWVLSQRGESTQDPTASARTWRAGVKLSLGTSPVWGFEVIWAGATESRDCNEPVKRQIHDCGAPCVPAQPRDALLRPWAYTARECLGKGAQGRCFSDAENLLGSPQGASGSEESASFLTKEVLKVSFRLQSAE